MYPSFGNWMLTSPSLRFAQRATNGDGYLFCFPDILFSIQGDALNCHQGFQSLEYGAAQPSTCWDLLFNYSTICYPYPPTIYFLRKKRLRMVGLLLPSLSQKGLQPVKWQNDWRGWGVRWVCLEVLWWKLSPLNLLD